MFLLQEIQVSLEESSTMKQMYNSSWGFVDKPGRSLRTESENPRGGVAIISKPYYSVTQLDPWQEEHYRTGWLCALLLCVPPF